MAVSSRWRCAHETRLPDQAITCTERPPWRNRSAATPGQGGRALLLHRTRIQRWSALPPEIHPHASRSCPPWPHRSTHKFEAALSDGVWPREAQPEYEYFAVPPEPASGIAEDQEEYAGAFIFVLMNDLLKPRAIVHSGVRNLRPATTAMARKEQQFLVSDQSSFQHHIHCVHWQFLPMS